jgi:hypothetical protein
VPALAFFFGTALALPLAAFWLLGAPFFWVAPFFEDFHNLQPRPSGHRAGFFARAEIARAFADEHRRIRGPWFGNAGPPVWNVDSLLFSHGRYRESLARPPQDAPCRRTGATAHIRFGP